MPSFHDWLLWKEGYWTHEIEHMRVLLAEDIAAASQDPTKKMRDGSHAEPREHPIGPGND